MKVTITAKIKILPNEMQIKWLKETMNAYKNGCNFVSDFVFKSENLQQKM